jgi:hypothetical protein
VEEMIIKNTSVGMEGEPKSDSVLSVVKVGTKGDGVGVVLDVDLNAFENMGSKTEAGQK